MIFQYQASWTLVHFLRSVVLSCGLSSGGSYRRRNISWTINFALICSYTAFSLLQSLMLSPRALRVPPGAKFVGLFSVHGMPRNGLPLVNAQCGLPSTCQRPWAQFRKSGMGSNKRRTLPITLNSLRSILRAVRETRAQSSQKY